MYLICDDVNEKEFYKLEDLKTLIPELKVNCFVMGKDAGYYLIKDWIEVGVHGWEHTYPPECERDNRREYIEKGLNVLKQYLPKKFGFRAPGFQLTASTYPILRELGFSFIAHQYRIQGLDGIFRANKNEGIVNTHIYDENIFKRIEHMNRIFKFLSEDFVKNTGG